MSCQSCGPALEVRIENSDGPAAQFAIRLIQNSIRQHVSFRRGKSRAAGAMRSLHVAAHSQALPDCLSAPEAIDACIDDAIRAADSVRARPLPANTRARARAHKPVPELPMTGPAGGRGCALYIAAGARPRAMILRLRVGAACSSCTSG